MRVKKVALFLAIGALVIGLFLIVQRKNQNSESRNGLPYRKIPSQYVGEWLNAEYLRILQKTHSPRQAILAPNVLIPSLHITEEDISWEPGFHEGAGFGVTDLRPGSESNSIVVIGAEDYGSSILLLNIVNVNTLAIAKNSVMGGETLTTEQVFRQIDDTLTTVINRISIAGEYYDAKGRSFSFSDAGIAIWPERRFTYEVNVDYVVEPGIDYLIDLTGRDSSGGYNSYAFERDGNALKLYNPVPSDNPGGEYDTIPFVILTKVE